MKSIKFKISGIYWKVFGFTVSASIFGMLMISSNVSGFIKTSFLDFDNNSSSMIEKSTDIVVTKSEILNDKRNINNFIKTGQKHESVEVLKLKVISSNGSFRLKELKIKIYGVADSYVSNLYFVDQYGRKYRSSIDEGYAVFKNIFTKMNDETLTFFADFEKTIQFGQRFRFEVEKPEDFVFTLYGRDVISDSVFPVAGDYFSIVGDKVAF